MKIIYENDGCDINVSVALGTFDGMHRGHQSIINNARSVLENSPVLVYAFENIPASFFGGKDKAILSIEEKKEVMRLFNVDYLCSVRFDEKIMNTSPEDFLNKLKNNYSAKAISCGFNYTFGKNAEGNSDYLINYCRQNSLQYSVSNPIMYENEPVSSTRIRHRLIEGNIRQVNAMLSYDYFIMGNVIHGKHLGNTIGFPTANLNFPEEKLVPKHGVYASYTIIDGVKYPSVTNIGLRPTVENTETVNAETYIVNYEDDLYGKKIKVCFIDFLREEHKFNNVAELKNQIENDKKIALQTYFRMLK